MFAPRSHLSPLGRINPRGIGELNLAKGKDIVLHEVHASLYDYVSFWNFHSKAIMRVLDLSVFRVCAPMNML